jgi:hypothetical protein
MSEINHVYQQLTIGRHTRGCRRSYWWVSTLIQMSVDNRTHGCRPAYMGVYENRYERRLNCIVNDRICWAILHLMFLDHFFLDNVKNISNFDNRGEVERLVL